MAKRLLLQGALVITDARSPARLQDILIEGNEIRDLPAAGTPVDGAEVCDLSGRLVHPGLISTHVHSHAGLTKGMADNWTLELLLAAGAGIYGSRSAADKYLSALMTAAELALKGTTACYDMSLEIPLPTPEGMAAVRHAYADVGIRALVAPMISDVPLWQAVPGLLERMPGDLRKTYAAKGSAAAVEAALRQVYDSWPAERLMSAPGIAPTIPLHCSDELWRRSLALADAFDLPVQCHLAESNTQARSGPAVYGESLTAHLDRIGALNGRFTGSHGVWLSKADMDILGRRGAAIAHNPGSNMVLGNGFARTALMKQAGITVGLGTDGSNCGLQNMYDSMRQALYVDHTASRNPADWQSCADMLEMATANGARILGRSDLGVIAPGKKADLVVLDLGAPHWMPLCDPVLQLVQSEDATAVDSVMVDGRWVVRNGKLTNIRLQDFMDRAAEAKERLARNNAAGRAAYKRLAPLVACVCCDFMRFDVKDQSADDLPAS